MKYVVFTEIHDNGKVECWYYDTYPTRDEANEVAYELGGAWPVYHGIVPANEARAWGVQNLPAGL